LAVQTSEEVRSYLQVALSCVCKKATKPFSRDEKWMPLNCKLHRSESDKKCMGLNEVQHRETSCTNMKEQKSKIVKLWVTDQDELHQLPEETGGINAKETD
jgi:hypothetical protein